MGHAAVHREPRGCIGGMHGCMAPNAELSRWDDVRVFLAVVRQGSFTLAAQTLETDQSTVSRRIAALESELGGPLFERTPRGPVTTELGARLREDAERMRRLALAQVGEGKLAALATVAGILISATWIERSFVQAKSQ